MISQEIGSSFEGLVSAQHVEYGMLGKAIAHHNRTVGRFVPGGKFVPDPDGSLPDFTVILKDRPAIIFMDAKSTGNEKRWTLSNRRCHQFEFMLKYSTQVGYCHGLFLVECRPRATFYLLKVDEEIELNSRGLPFIRFDREMHNLKSFRDYRCCDYLKHLDL